MAESVRLVCFRFKLEMSKQEGTDAQARWACPSALLQGAHEGVRGVLAPDGAVDG